MQWINFCWTSLCKNGPVKQAQSQIRERLIHLLSHLRAEFKTIQGDKEDFLHVCLMYIVVSSGILQTAPPWFPVYRSITLPNARSWFWKQPRSWTQQTSTMLAAQGKLRSWLRDDLPAVELILSMTLKMLFRRAIWKLCVGRVSVLKKGSSE